MERRGGRSAHCGRVRRHGRRELRADRQQPCGPRFLDELHAVLRADMTTEQLREAVSFCVSKANAAVNRHAQEHTECHGMGTTLVSAVTNGSGAVICNVGDSRAYRVGTERLERITRDHSVVEGLIESGNITAEQAHAPQPQPHHPRARPRGAYRVRRIRCDARRGRAAAALLGRAGRHRHGRGDVMRRSAGAIRRRRALSTCSRAFQTARRAG